MKQRSLRRRGCHTAEATAESRRTGQPFAGVRGSEGYEGQRACGVRGLCCGTGVGVAPHGGVVDPSGAGRAGPGPDRVGQGVAVLGPDRRQSRGVRAGNHGPHGRVRMPTADLPDLPLVGNDDDGDVVSTRQSLMAALVTLPARQRAVVVLRFFHDYTEAATAEAMGISVGTVKSQTFRALAALRVCDELCEDAAPDLTGSAQGGMA